VAIIGIVIASIKRCQQRVGCEDVGAKSFGIFMLDTVYILELVDKKCYLGDILEKGGGAEKVSRTRMRCAW